mgnify:CR=1 FL=1
MTDGTELNQNDDVIDEDIQPSENNLDDFSTHPNDEKSQAYTEVVQLYLKILNWNPTSYFEDSSQLIFVAQRLLMDYYEQSINFINNNDENQSLLQEFSSDGLVQWHLHKGFREMFGVYLY